MSHRCPSCARQLVEIHLETPQADLVLQHCSPCDRRTWVESGRPTTRDQALELISGLAR